MLSLKLESTGNIACLVYEFEALSIVVFQGKYLVQLLHF